MRYLPLFFDLKDRKVIVVGGGEAAAQKIRLLLKTEAHIILVAPTVIAELAELARAGRLAWCEERFQQAHLDNACLVYATERRQQNLAVASAARARSIPLNAVDMPDLCDVITPAIVERGCVVVAIGTEGAAPVLARRIKSHLESWLPQKLGDVVEAARKLRGDVASRISCSKARRSFWDQFWSGPIEALLVQGQDARSAIARLFYDTGSPGLQAAQGRVSLVGAGPGSADLLTFRAMQRLQEADVIIYDWLVAPEVLDCARRDAKRIYVGKPPGERCISQDDINQILIREALAGQHVVRLKCGDPMIFGRASEEMAALDDAGIAYDIVPGVTAATACAAEAGLSLTVRENIRSVVFLTGHCMNGPTPYDWSAVAQPGTVLALYMGVRMAPTIQANLLAVGTPGQTSVTIVEKGCTDRSRTVRCTLASLASTISKHAISNPALIYIQISARAKPSLLPQHRHARPAMPSLVSA